MQVHKDTDRQIFLIHAEVHPPKIKHWTLGQLTRILKINDMAEINRSRMRKTTMEQLLEDSATEVRTT